MTRKYKLSALLFLLVFSMYLPATQIGSDWIVGAVKFSYTNGADDSVSKGLSETLPVLILEKINSGLYRDISLTEQEQRNLYELRTERNSLFLQLSAEVKKRDSLVLADYSQSEFEKKVNEQNKKIQEIKDQLKKNEESQSISYIGKYFIPPEPLLEKISLYNNSISSLYNPSGQALAGGFTGPVFEKEIIKAGIRCLITGTITLYQEYMAVTVKAYNYPGAKEIASITEIGSIDEADFITSNITRQLSPVFANSLPSVLNINFVPVQTASQASVYIDDILTSVQGEIILDSGVHFIQFTAPGYRNCGTSYFFEGNKNYTVEVSLEPAEEQLIYLRTSSLLEGQLLANGIKAEKNTDGIGKIVINGKNVLGEFITPDNKTAFFYIPEKKIQDGVLYTAKLNPLDHSDYIEKRRRGMYLSYSVLVTSLIPTIITKGIVKNYRVVLGTASAAENVEDFDTQIKKGNAWITVANISTGVSIACGIWFIFEMYRYFKAADSMLPASTKMTYDYVPKTEEPVEELVEESVEE